MVQKDDPFMEQVAARAKELAVDKAYALLRLQMNYIAFGDKNRKRRKQRRRNAA